MQSKATTVAQYLAELPADRRAALQAVRRTIIENLDTRGPHGDGGYEEGMSYGMIAYCVPHRLYPAGYHCNPKQPLPFAGLASQKNYMSLYLMSPYGGEAEEAWLREQFAKAGKKLDMGKCCIRFRKLEDLPLAVIGEAIRRVPVKAYLEQYQKAMLAMNKTAAARAGKTAPRKAAARKASPRGKASGTAKKSRAKR